MRKRRERKEDGRYIIFYEFEQRGEPEESETGERGEQHATESETR